MSIQNFEYKYLELLRSILADGEVRADRTGTGTLALFGQSLRIDLSKGFPLLTTKKLGFKSISSELLWFIEGSGDERRLAEILHGTRDPAKKTIWSANAEADYWKPKAKFEGDLGRIYGVQWRTWNRYTEIVGASEPTYLKTQPVDQLAELIHKLKTSPTDRRLLLTAWNPGELPDMGLPPCHLLCQFYLSNERKLSCQMYQRSADEFLGVPYNIASYALLVHLIAHVIKAEVGELILIFGDSHIYRDHIKQVQEQLTRVPFESPKLVFNREVTDIDDFKMTDFQLEGYTSHPAIQATMSV